LLINVLASVPQKVAAVKSSITDKIKIAVVSAAVKAVSYFMRKIAYDTATWLASGGKGQNPFAHTKSFGSYIENVANEAAGTAITALGQPFGLNLCKIPDIRMNLAMRLGLNSDTEADSRVLFWKKRMVKYKPAWEGPHKPKFKPDAWPDSF